MRIAHIISGLGTGGAELFLGRLIHSINHPDFEHVVVSLTTLGIVGKELQSKGVQVHALQAGWYPNNVFKILNLKNIMKRYQPDLIQGWMYHGNLAAYVTQRYFGVRCPMLWNIRHSLDQWAHEKLRLRILIRISSLLSKAPERIIFNANNAARQHESLGYPKTKSVIIHNGYDLVKFAPNESLRMQMRERHGITAGNIVFGMFSRFHPLKDHGNFLRAARIVADANHNVRFILAGKDITSGNVVLMQQIRELRLENLVMLLGERGDVSEIMNILDIYVSSSSSEAFPNAVAEAMSCGVPCVVTNVGDSAELVAEAGIIVPPKAHQQLARAMLQLIEAGHSVRRDLGVSARRRIESDYSNEAIARQYADLYRMYN